MWSTSHWLSLSGLLVLPPGISTAATVADVENWGPWGMHMMWGSWGLGMMLMMFLFWAVIIVGIVFLIRWLVSSGPSRQPTLPQPPPESALDILKKRYARGEISKSEFDQMHRDLQ